MIISDFGFTADVHLVQNSETYVINAKSLLVKEENIQNMGKKSQNKYIYERYKIWVLAYHGQQSSGDWWPTIGSVEPTAYDRPIQMALTVALALVVI